MKKRDNILQAALKLFVENGEQSTSMKLIGREAKCGIGTMYNYFASKNELMNELYKETKAEMFKFILEALDTNVPVKKQFIDVWLKAIDYALSNPLAYKFLDMFSHSPKISKQINNELNELILPILEIYEKGKTEGIIKNINTVHLVIFTTGGITESVLNSPNITDSEIKTIILMAWDAIKK